MTPLNKIISVRRRFLRSVNIARDQKRAKGLEGYIITPLVLQTLAQISDSFTQNITDRALLKFIIGNFPQDKKIIHSIPFDSKNKYSLTSISDGTNIVHLVKGAPEKIIPQCQQYYDENGKKKRLHHIQT